LPPLARVRKQGAEIRLRAIAQIGKISRELERRKGRETELLSTVGKKFSKADQL
jgi:hypothetical protein